MAIPEIGSLSSYGPSGRLGIVVGSQAVGAARDGRQLVALKIKSLDAAGKSPSVADLPPGRIEAPNRIEVPDRIEAIDPKARTGITPAARTPDALTAKELAAVTRLQQRDAQVRQEENAHAAAAGDLAGPITYSYQLGPDGRRYAVGGGVSIQARSVSGDPQEAARMAARMVAAAQAATNPSGADLAAARSGYSLMASAGAQQNQRGQALDHQV